jgi:hypothetical protein
VAEDPRNVKVYTHGSSLLFPEVCQFTKRFWKKQDGEQLLKQSMVELLTLHAD